MKKTLFALLWFVICASSQAGQTILVFGDSLSAGFGIGQEQSWPALLAQRLAAARDPYQIANASISGETTSGGLSRLAPALRQFQPAIVIIELGANDGLRGLSLKQMRANLDEMIRLCQDSHAQVVLVGIRLPPNYGLNYTAQFAAIYADLGRRHKTALVPFLFEGFAGNRDAFQEDGLHPTAATQPMMLANVWRALLPLLRKP